MKLHILLFSLALVLSTALAHQTGTKVSPNQRMAHLTVLNPPGQPSQILVQLEPHGVAGKTELMLSITQGRTHYRQVLQPLGQDQYRLEYRFPQGGSWNFYLRYGPGQAGYVGSINEVIQPGSGNTQEIDLKLFNGYSGNVPAYVQPLGFAAFGLLALAALLSVVWLLRWIERQAVPAV